MTYFMCYEHRTWEIQFCVLPFKVVNGDALCVVFIKWSSAFFKTYPSVCSVLVLFCHSPIYRKFFVVYNYPMEFYVLLLVALSTNWPWVKSSINWIYELWSNKAKFHLQWCMGNEWKKINNLEMLGYFLNRLDIDLNHLTCRLVEIES